ncbi:hypothetical protein ABT336_04860 [Micromonospora sp. NPDC000207]|uniref:hypothetical protein n=1 Tax=Micromonospora sp. NPDC000207 TaxID=3154246 RepID=UPI00332C3FC9
MADSPTQRTSSPPPKEWYDQLSDFPALNIRENYDRLYSRYAELTEIENNDRLSLMERKSAATEKARLQTSFEKGYACYWPNTEAGQSYLLKHGGDMRSPEAIAAGVPQMTGPGVPRIAIAEVEYDQRHVSAVASSASPMPGKATMLAPEWPASQVQSSGQAGHVNPSSPSSPPKADNQGGRPANRAKTNS